MPCFHPLSAYQSPHGGKPVFKDRVGFKHIYLPCGRCIGCRLERSRQWAVRCVHESTLHFSNCFVTLTYSPDRLPVVDGVVVPTLRKSDFQLFMKRLRKHFSGNKIRFFACGEYGENTRRPHYHAILFGVDFMDKVVYRKFGEHTTYVSDTLNRIWGLGHCIIGTVTFESAAYVARYITKKVTGEAANEHYKVVDKTTGELFNLLPEFSLQSLKPGIGAGWYEKYNAEVYPVDSVLINYREVKPPRYYDKLFEINNPDSFSLIKEKRVRKADLRDYDNTPRRNRVKEKVTEAKLKLKGAKL